MSPDLSEIWREFDGNLTKWTSEVLQNLSTEIFSIILSDCEDRTNNETRKPRSPVVY